MDIFKIHSSFFEWRTFRALLCLNAKEFSRTYTYIRWILLRFHTRLSNNRRISIRAIGYGNRTRQFKEGIRQKRERTFNREALCSLRSQSLSLLRSGKSENDCFVTGVPFPRNIASFPKITSRYSRQRTSTVRPIFSFQPCFKTVRGWGDIIVYPLRIRAKSYTVSEDSSSSIVIRNVLEKHALLSMSPRYDLVSRDEHLMLYAHDKSVYSIIIIQCWSLIDAILQLKYPNSSSSSRYYILSRHRWGLVESNRRDERKRLMPLTSSKMGGMLKPRRNVDRHTDGGGVGSAYAGNE